MVVPDWFIKLFEVLGLKKKKNETNDQAQHHDKLRDLNEAQLHDELRNLNDDREKKYKELENIESKIKTLEKRLVIVVNPAGKEQVSFTDTDITKAKSDVYILRSRFNAISKSLAMINTRILQLQMIIDSGEIDESAKKMENTLSRLNKAVENLEYAAGIKEIVDDTVIMGQEIEINDVTVASSSTNEMPEINIANNKFANKESGNTNKTV